ncbi:MAG TPA: hypothetical protein VNO33_21260 [Kofleriaceae bacterium]|nr:hypothetical protein [Kofleriaceae bacterium]
MEPSTDDLPFLLVHGPLIWKVALAALMAAALTAVWFVRRRGARRRAFEAVAAIDRGGETEGVLRGTLGGAGAGPLAATLWAVDREKKQSVLVDWRADEVWLQTATARVALDGPIRVVAGGRSTSARRGVPRATSDAHLRAATDAAPWVHARLPPWRAQVHASILVSLAPGDEVVVTGRLDRSPGSEATGYRSADVVWTMRAPDDRPIGAGARRPRATATRLSLFAAAAIAGLALLVGWGAMSLYGDSVRKECWRESVGLGRPEPDLNHDADADHPIEIPGSCGLAAATPGDRDYLHSLFGRLEDHSYRDEQALRRLAAVASLDTGCAGVIDVFMEHERYEEAAAHADRCGDDRARHIALLSLGRFAEAAAIRVPADEDQPALPDGATLIAAGRWVDAAEAAEARERESIRAREADPALTQLAPGTVLPQHCLAQMLRHHGGDREAAHRLRALALEPGGEVCIPAIWSITPDETLRRLAWAFRHPEWLLWVAGAADGPSERVSAETVIARPEHQQSVGSAWLAWLAAPARAALASDASPIRKANALRWTAVALLFDGDTAGAEAAAREAAALAPSHDPENWPENWLDDTSLLPAVVGLYTQSTQQAFDLQRFDRGRDSETKRELRRWRYEQLLVRRGDPFEPRFLMLSGEQGAALSAAQQGDGRLLARWIGRHGLQSEGDTNVMAALPRVTRGREALARQLTWSAAYFPNVEHRMQYEFPWSVAVHAVVRREVLRRAGATEAAARWHEIYRRFDEVFDDRRRFIALILWDS